MDDEERTLAIANAAIQGFTDERVGKQYRLDPESGTWQERTLPGREGMTQNVEPPRRRRLMGPPGPVSSVPTINAEDPYDDNESHWDTDVLPLPKPLF